MRVPAVRALTSLSVAVVLTWAGVSHAMASPVLSGAGLPAAVRMLSLSNPAISTASSVKVSAAVARVSAVKAAADVTEDAAIIEVGQATSSSLATPTAALTPVSSSVSAPATTSPASTTQAAPATSAVQPTTSAVQPTTSAAATTSPAATTSAVRSTTSVAATTSAAATTSVQSTSSAPAGTPRLRFGLGTPGGLYDAAELGPVETAVGESPSIILAYSDFTQAAPIDGLDAVSSRGQTPMLTWEPWQAGGADQPNYSLGRIIAGDYDTYIKSWATSLKGWGKPVLLRFAHEMNGNWYPWSEQANGNQPGQYVAAWRHVHDLFTATGERNVSWVWSPNVAYEGSTPLAELYPGAGYVDVVAMDGYNWGSTNADSHWTSPADLFGSTIAALKSLAPGLPIIIGETSSAEAGGSKAEWITSLVSYLQTQSAVTAFIWFDFNKEADWRINSSDASVSAFKAALAARR